MTSSRRRTRGQLARPALDAAELGARRGPRVERDHRMSARCSTLATSPGSALGPAANQASRISPSSGSEVARRLSASTLASFHVRAPAAVAASAHSAARIPCDLVGGDRRARPGPAADHGLLGTPLGDVARGRLRGPRPVVALGVAERTVHEDLVAAAAQLRHDGVGDSDPFVGGDGDAHGSMMQHGDQRPRARGDRQRCISARRRRLPFGVTSQRRKEGAHVSHVRRPARQDGQPRVGGRPDGRRARRRVRARLGPSDDGRAAGAVRQLPAGRPAAGGQAGGQRAAHPSGRASITRSTSTPSTAAPRAWPHGCASRAPRRRSRCRASHGTSRCPAADLARLAGRLADPLRGYTASERKLIREYDQLARERRNRERRSALFHLMKAQRKRVWRAAQPAADGGDGRGWDHANRRARYRSLLSRTN